VVAALAFLMSVVTCPAAVLAACAAGVLCCFGFVQHHSGSDSDPGGRRLAGWMLAAWWIGLLVSTPLYRPYVRLMLPWLAACWIAGGALLAHLARGKSPGMIAAEGRARLWSAVKVLFAIAIIAVAWQVGAGRLNARGMVAWQPRTGLVQVAAEIAREAAEIAARQQPGQPDQKVVYVYAEPAMLFQLRLLGLDPVRPVGGLAFARPDAPPSPVPVFLVAGPHADRDPHFAAELARAGSQLILVKSFDYHPSDLVLLDSRHPRDLLRRPDRPTEAVRLYRMPAP
jgi:hypothetical protein